MIDLATFRKTNTLFNSNCLAYLCGCCKIGQNKFFIYGGYGKDYLGSAGILDLTKKSFETLQSDSKIGYNGLCLANDEVYCFGGYGSGTLKESKKFNLEKKSGLAFNYYQILIIAQQPHFSKKKY